MSQVKKSLGIMIGLIGLIWMGVEYGYKLPIMILLMIWGNNLEQNANKEIKEKECN